MLKMEVKQLLPIFIGYTRSFWFGILPALLTLVDVLMKSVTDDSLTPVASSIATIIGWVFGWTADEIFGFMAVISPIYALIVAQQRSGITRPYVASPQGHKTEDAAILVKNVLPPAAPHVEAMVRRAI